MRLPSMGAWPLVLLLLLCGSTSASAQHQTQPPLGIQDEGGTETKPVFTLDCVGAGIECTQSGTTGTLTVGGGGSGNSFETITPPAGASVVADSSTDTLTLTETSFLTLTGTAATDTIDITQVTTDLGTDGLIAANAVALTTDTTGNYVGTVGDCTASEGAACFEGTAGTTLTFNDASGDQTLIYNVGADLDFNFSDDLNIRDATPHLQWVDTTASQDDFESYADASQWYLTNVTDAIELIRFNASNNLFLRGGSVTYSWPTVDGTSGQVLQTNGSGVLSFATGSGGNSFETIAVPAGASVVADSATDTIDITQVTTDLGTDGLIAANAVALGTDTTNAYVADLTAGTYIDVSGGGAETANVTVTMDATEVEAVTWGAGGNASNVWTFNLSGTDPVVTLSSGTFGVTDGVLTVADAVTNGNMTTLSTTNTATYGVSGLRTIRGASLSTTSSGAANNTGLQAGLLVDNEVTGTGTLTSNFGIDVTNSATGGTTGTISANTGLRITHEGFPDDGSTVTTSTGIDLIASTTTSDFTNAYGLKIAIDSDPGSTGTSRYAIYFADGTEALGADATNEYGLFQVGTAMNKLSNLSIGNGATSAGVLTLLEDTDAGSNFASFQVPALAANTVYTLPIDDGAASEVLSTDGAGALDWVAAGAGDITDVYNCASGDCNNIVLADGDLLNMSSVSVSATTEGLILPQHATDCSTAGTAEGQVCWEADANTLYVGDGTTVTQVGAGGSGDVTDVGPGCATGACFTDTVTTTGSSLIVWEGSTSDVDEFTIAVPADPVDDATATFASATGKVALGY